MKKYKYTLYQFIQACLDIDEALNERYLLDLTSQTQNYIYNILSVISGAGRITYDLIENELNPNNPNGNQIAIEMCRLLVTNYLNELTLLTNEKVIVTRENNKDLFTAYWNESFRNSSSYWVQRFITIYNATKERYITLLNIYKDNKGKLLNDVTSIVINENTFNDIPQNTGDFSGEEYATNYTKNVNTAASQIDTLMNRIEQIDKKYQDIMLNWIKEFKSLFIDPSLDEENELENFELGGIEYNG